MFLRWQEGAIGLNQTFSKVLTQNFSAIENIYDTELFLPTDYDSLEISDEYLAEVIKIQGPAAPSVYKKIGYAGQQSLDDRGIYGYNFNTLTIDIMGSAYERYLAHQISLDGDRVYITETDKLRKKEGIYYTPPYVVDYIVEKTLKPKLQPIFEDAKNLLRKDDCEEAFSKIQEISFLKVLDPSCGSGSFLIKAFDTIAKYYIDYNNSVDSYYKEQLKKNGLKDILQLSRYKIEAIGERILLDNIYGVDFDSQAVEITKLNLWLKTLSLNPASYKPIIGKKIKKLLPSLSTNIKQGNSLISGFEKASNVNSSILKQIGQMRKKLQGYVLEMSPYGKQTIEHQEQKKNEFDALMSKEKEVRSAIILETDKVFETWFNEKGIGLNGLSGQPFNWEIEFAEVFLRNNGGFDIIIGNPPHGGQLSPQERKYIEKNYEIGKGYKNTAFLFIERAVLKLRKHGKLGFVIPKSLTFAQKWNKVRQYLIDNYAISEIGDISKAFKGVLLEQVVTLVDKDESKPTTFRGRYLDASNREIGESYEIPIDLCRDIDAFPIYATEKSIEIYKNIKAVSVSLDSISRTFRGLPLQNKLKENKENGYEEVIIGDDICRYCSVIPRKYLPSALLSKSKVASMKKEKIISQRIVAHVLRPIDHIIFMSTFDDKGLASVDTVENTIITNDNYKTKQILALINSRLVGWFAYLFVYNKAIRTMDFDGYYVGKIPIAKALSEGEDNLSSLVDLLLVLSKQKRWLASAFKNLLSTFNMGKNEKLSFFISSSHIAELHGINLSGTSHINQNEKGTIENYEVLLEGDDIVIRVRILERKEKIEIVRIKFDKPLFREYFYNVLKDYEGVRNFSKIQKLYETTLNTMMVPRFANSFLVEDNSGEIKLLMDALKREFTKVKQGFAISPVLEVDMARIVGKINETEEAINTEIFRAYGLSKDQIELIRKETVSLSKYV
jgi:type I restriction-modification system DNA methylase subunit